MKPLLSIVVVAMLLIGAAILSGPRAQDQTPSIAALQADGWRIIEKTERQDRLPGLPPYENLVRVVQIVQYRLRKGDRLMHCKATYDSQRDHYGETCRGAHP